LLDMKTYTAGELHSDKMSRVKAWLNSQHKNERELGAAKSYRHMAKNTLYKSLSRLQAIATRKIKSIQCCADNLKTWLLLAAELNRSGLISRLGGIKETEYIWFIDNADSQKLAVKCSEVFPSVIYITGERPMPYDEQKSQRLTQENKGDIISEIKKRRGRKYICVPHTKNGFIDMFFSCIVKIFAGRYIRIYDDGLNILHERREKGSDRKCSRKKPRICFGWKSRALGVSMTPLHSVDYGYKELVSSKKDRLNRKDITVHIIGSKYLNFGEQELAELLKRERIDCKELAQIRYYMHPNKKKCFIPDVSNIVTLPPFCDLIDILLEESSVGDIIVCGYSAAMRHLSECNLAGAGLRLYISISNKSIGKQEEEEINRYLEALERHAAVLTSTNIARSNMQR